MSFKVVTLVTFWGVSVNAYQLELTHVPLLLVENMYPPFGSNCASSSHSSLNSQGNPASVTFVVFFE